MDVIGLLVVEMRRALHRRVVWALIAMALAGILILGVVAYFDSAGKSTMELRVDGTHPALMADWWVAGTGDGLLMVAALPLLLGALFGGASVAGAEWRAGTVTTVLTWEPRRLRLHASRTTSAFVLATAIALILEVVFLAAFVPAVMAHGSTAGTDGAWFVALVAAVARIALLSGMAAVLGVSLATLGRGTTFAIGAAFGWIAVAENIIRGLKPSLQHLLVGENLTIVVTWAPLRDLTRSAPVALATVAMYFSVVALIAVTVFVRRDIAGTG